MLVEAKISNKMGILDRGDLVRLKSVIKGVDLPTEIPDLEVAKIIQAMKHDKKILQGKLRFALPKSIGDVFITDEVAPSLIEQVLSDWNEEA